MREKGAGRAQVRASELGRLLGWRPPGWEQGERARAGAGSSLVVDWAEAERERAGELGHARAKAGHVDRRLAGRLGEIVRLV